MQTDIRHGNATLALTDDELGALRERVPAGTELAAILADAQPSDEPRTVLVTGDERDENDIPIVTGSVTYTHFITLPPGDHSLALRALEAEGTDTADLAAFEPPVEGPAEPGEPNPASLVMP